MSTAEGSIFRTANVGVADLAIASRPRDLISHAGIGPSCSPTRARCCSFRGRAMLRSASPDLLAMLAEPVAQCA
jgi:hypothetical protein